MLIFLQVRDRATLYITTLEGDGSVVETDKDVKDFLFGSLDLPLVNLETSLKTYVGLLQFLFPIVLIRSSSNVFTMDTGTFGRTF